MNKLRYRFTGVATALLVSVGCFSGYAVSARNAAAENFEMSLLTTEDHTDTLSVSTLDIQENDVVLRVGLYIQSEDWTEDDGIIAVSAEWESSDSSHIFFRNMVDLNETCTQKTCDYSGGSYTTRYESPYCFINTVKLKNSEREGNRQINVTTTANAYDPVFGSDIYQADYNQIQFTYKYYESEADKEADTASGTRDHLKTRVCMCPIQYNNNGEAYFEFEYIRPDNFERDTAVSYLPGYDPNLEAGEKVPGKCNFLMLINKSVSPLTFFGDTSDEFSLITFDTVIKKGTPAGIYQVNLQANDRTFITGAASKQHMPASANGLTIIVDDNAPPQTEPEATTTEAPVLTETTETIASETTAIETTAPEMTTETTTVVMTETSTETESVIETEFTEETTTTETTGTTTTEEQTMAPLQPLFLDSGRTVYVDDQEDVTIYNTGNSQVAWLVDHPSIVSIDGIYDNTVYFTALEPGEATIFAIVGGKAIPYTITVLENPTNIEESASLYGDVNCDGNVALDDLILLSKYSSGSVQLSHPALLNSDCNDDHIVDTSDSILLQRFLIKLVNALPYVE